MAIMMIFNPEKPGELIQAVVLHEIELGDHYVVAYLKDDGEVVVGEILGERFTAYLSERRKETMSRYEQTIQEYVRAKQLAAAPSRHSPGSK